MHNVFGDCKDATSFNNIERLKEWGRYMFGLDMVKSKQELKELNQVHIFV